MKWKWDHISHFWTEAFRAMTGSLYCSFSLSPDWHISHRGCSITWMLERMWHLGQSHSWQLQPTWARNRLCYYRQLWPFFVTSHTTEKANTTATDLAEEREYKGGWHQNSTFQPERTSKPKKKKKITIFQIKIFKLLISMMICQLPFLVQISNLLQTNT